jgi:hypothetical protein
MSWLFSQALVAEYSAATCWDGAPSAPLSVMPTPHKFWRNDKPMEPSQLSRFGLTCAVLTDDRGEALLTWFRAGFPARTYPLPGLAPALMASAPGFGEKWHESSVRFDRDSSSWRTHRCLWDEALPWSSVTLPRWGSMVDGLVYLHPTAARPMTGIAPGWLGETFPTPSVAMGKGSSEGALTRVDGRSRLRNRLDYWVERDGKSGRLNPDFVEWVMGWPIGWTALEPLAMARFHEWQQQHSPTYHKAGSDAA